MPTLAGIIDTALHPPLGALWNHLDGNGPYGSGDHTLTTWLDGATTRNVNDTFGALVILNGSIPAGWGYNIGWDSLGPVFDGYEYHARLVQVVVQHQLQFGLGGWVTTDLVDCRQLATLVLWSEALPGRIGLNVAPGLAFDLQFLMASP